MGAGDRWGTQEPYSLSIVVENGLYLFFLEHPHFHFLLSLPAVVLLGNQKKKRT